MHHRQSCASGPTGKWLFVYLLLSQTFALSEFCLVRILHRFALIGISPAGRDTQLLISNYGAAPSSTTRDTSQHH